MRFVEILLFAAPFLVFLAWRIVAPSGDPPRMLVIGMSATVLAVAGLLVTLWYVDEIPAGGTYVPARQEDGRIVPAHVERSVPPPLGDREIPPLAAGQR
jgi:protein-S-isoprenylcysteine O-methyltransferase Ste14